MRAERGSKGIVYFDLKDGRDTVPLLEREVSNISAFWRSGFITEEEADEIIAEQERILKNVAERGAAIRAEKVQNQLFEEATKQLSQTLEDALEHLTHPGLKVDEIEQLVQVAQRLRLEIKGLEDMKPSKLFKHVRSWKLVLLKEQLKEAMRDQPRNPTRIGEITIEIDRVQRVNTPVEYYQL
jgi:hypothetical protein